MKNSTTFQNWILYTVKDSGGDENISALINSLKIQTDSLGLRDEALLAKIKSDLLILVNNGFIQCGYFTNDSSGSFEAINIEVISLPYYLTWDEKKIVGLCPRICH